MTSRSRSRARRKRKARARHKRLAAVNWLELPPELTASIFGLIDQAEILSSVQFVCKKWLRMCREPHMWRSIALKCPIPFQCPVSDLPNPKKPSDVALRRRYEKLCLRALHYASNLLTDITLDHFATDRLLLYIADRSGRQIRCLRLRHCFSIISSKALVKAVAKLPNLEELEILRGYFSRFDLKDIGTCCPNLTTFKFNCRHNYTILGYNDPYGDDVAFEIVTNFPKLRHLELISNSITDAGLRLILDGYSNLESLNLFLCINLDLKDNLLERCRRQIKHLQLPLDGVCNEANREFRSGTIKFEDPCSIYHDLMKEKPLLLTSTTPPISSCECVQPPAEWWVEWLKKS